MSENPHSIDATSDFLEKLKIDIKTVNSIRFTTFRETRLLHIVIEYSREEDARRDELRLTPGHVAQIFMTAPVD